MRSPLLGLLAVASIAGCAGRTDPTADEIRLVISEPTSGSNVNLTRFDTATDITRSRSGTTLTITATQNPGPIGLSSRVCRVFINEATPGTDYSLQPAGNTYVELTETSTTGTRAWRSQSGMLSLQIDETNLSQALLTNVVMAPYSGNAFGQFKMQGPIIIRF
jgi:hypothetical protein